MQIKTILIFPFSPARITNIKKTTIANIDENTRKKWALIHCLWECKIVQPPWKTYGSLLQNVWKFIAKLIKQPSYDCCTTLGNLSERV
jgi:hypothetical protein